jgi:hypothetical protein
MQGFYCKTARAARGWPCLTSVDSGQDGSDPLDRDLAVLDACKRPAAGTAMVSGGTRQLAAVQM